MREDGEDGQGVFGCVDRWDDRVLRMYMCDQSQRVSSAQGQGAVSAECGGKSVYIYIHTHTAVTTLITCVHASTPMGQDEEDGGQ